MVMVMVMGRGGRSLWTIAVVGALAVVAWLAPFGS